MEEVEEVVDEVDKEREGGADDGGNGGDGSESLMGDARSIVMFELHDLRTESVRRMSCCCASVRRRL